MTKQFTRGDRVVYRDYGRAEEGIVKRMSDDGEALFVLFHTKLMRYTEHDLDNYTSQRCNVSDVEHGTL